MPSAHPDSNIHKSATGPAAETVAKHQDPQDIIFWSGWFCPFNQRIWMALEERNISYQYHEVNPYEKSEAFLKVNPLGLVPAIEEAKSKRSLYESDILLEYVEELVPESAEHPSIFPKGVYEKSWARLQVNHISKKILPKYFSLQQAQDPSDQATARDEFYAAIRTLLERRNDSAQDGPFFFGKQFTVVEMAFAPFVRRFATLEEFRAFKHEDVGEGWVEWKDAMMNHPSLIATTSEDEYYRPLLMRYIKNEAQSEVAKATRGGKSLP